MAMQGDELRSIRRGLGWTIAQMSQVLGLSETFVGQMERGQKPIEPRTALAARYIALSGKEEIIPDIENWPSQ